MITFYIVFIFFRCLLVLHAYNYILIYCAAEVNLCVGPLNIKSLRRYIIKINYPNEKNTVKGFFSMDVLNDII